MMPMKLTNITTSLIILISLVGYSSLSYSAKSISLADIVSNQVVDVRLIDRCSDRIPADRTARDVCRKQTGGDEEFPPTASESCAYDRIGDELKLSFDEVQVSEKNIDTYIKVKDEDKNIVYDKKVPQLLFDVYTLKRRVEPWSLKDQAGQPLQVGRQGKKYTIQMERRNQDDVLYSSGVIDVLVDDCELRNQKIVSMISDPSIEHTPGFDLYLELLNSVSTKICNKIKTGLLGDAGADTFSQRCRYQCINNSFTNELIDQAYAGLNTPLSKVHDDVNAETSDKFHFFDNARFGIDVVDERFMLLSYITYEDSLRAQGYFNCNGPLNSSDIDISIGIIEESVEEVVLPIVGAVGAKVSRQIVRHLVNTENIYMDLPK